MKKTLKIVGNVLVWLFVAFAALMTIMVFSSSGNKDGMPNILGKIPLAILSDSMKGTFNKGDLIVVDALSTEERGELQVGEIISFKIDLNKDNIEEINTHRIVDVTANGGYIYYTTKGDNADTNVINDENLIRYDMVVGRYNNFKVPGLGSAMNFVKSPNGFMIVIVFPLVLFFLFELYRFIAVVVASKSKSGISAAEEEEIKQRAVEEYLKQQAIAKSKDDSSNQENEENV